MPLTVSLGWPIRSLVGVGIVPPLPDVPIATSPDTPEKSAIWTSK
jgi:hypothetical protein